MLIPEPSITWYSCARFLPFGNSNNSILRSGSDGCTRMRLMSYFVTAVGRISVTVNSTLNKHLNSRSSLVGSTTSHLCCCKSFSFWTKLMGYALQYVLVTMLSLCDRFNYFSCVEKNTLVASFVCVKKAVESLQKCPFLLACKIMLCGRAD